MAALGREFWWVVLGLALAGWLVLSCANAILDKKVADFAS